MSSITIREVQNKSDLNIFIKFPWEIYKNDPHWVPPLLIDMKTILSKKKNPFYQHSEIQLFLALKGGRTVGRIAAILNRNHNKFHEEKTGFFGFFESVNDVMVVESLLTAAKLWLKGKGMSTIRGPMNLTTNDTCGMLCEGFDSAPYIMMTYNPQYYIDLMHSAGMQKCKELYAYYMTQNTEIPERFIKFAQKAMQDDSITFRNINMKKFDAEVKIVMEIYNDAWQKNWGFVPMTDAEIQHMANELRMGVDPDIVFIAEIDGEPAGFSLALPDFNQVLQKINGRLLPFGIFKLLKNKSKIDTVRVLTLGVKQKFQKKRALAPAFYYETYRRGIEKGYHSGEFSWILDDNMPMNRAITGLGASLYKKYAIYEAEIR